MGDREEIDIAYRLLDDDLIDSDGRRCGKVDDIELDGEPGADLEVRALLVGPGTFRERVPKRLRPLARRLFYAQSIRVEWSDVESIDVTVELSLPSKDLGLGRGDDLVGEAVKRLVDR
jgi:sporulation protein YlmC with PRC-barrel domain